MCQVGRGNLNGVFTDTDTRRASGSLPHSSAMYSSPIDASKAPHLKEEIARRIQNGQSGLILDLSSVDFIDSIGFGMLVSCLKLLANGETRRIIGA